MDEVAEPKALVVDGANVATSNRARPSLARLESAIGALRAAIPSAECVVFVADDLRDHLDDEELDRFDELVAAQVIGEVPADARGGPAEAILAAAEAVDAAVVSNDSYHRERDGFPWLRDVSRLIGHSYGGDGWWVFMTRGATGHISWTGHDAAAPAIESLRATVKDGELLHEHMRTEVRPRFVADGREAVAAAQEVLRWLSDDPVSEDLLDGKGIPMSSVARCVRATVTNLNLIDLGYARLRDLIAEAAEGTALAVVVRAEDTYVVREAAARAGLAATDGEPVVAPPAPEHARTYDDLVLSAPPALAIVPHAVVQDAVAILLSSAQARPRDELVADLVTAELGLSMYGAAALLYRFEGAGIAREVEPGKVERSPDITVRAAIDGVCDDILEDLLTLGANALGARDEPAARRALGLPMVGAARSKGATRAPAKKPSPARSPAGHDAEAPAAPKARAGKARSTSKAPGSKKAPAKASATKAAAKKTPGKVRATNATAEKAPAKTSAAKTAKTAKTAKAPAVRAAATKAPAKQSASPAPARGKPRARSTPKGVEWVARCPVCGRELVAPDRGGAAAKLDAHRCAG